MAKKTSYGTVSNDEDVNDARTSFMTTDLESQQQQQQQQQHQRSSSSATKNASKSTAKKIALAFSACAVTFAVASRQQHFGNQSIMDKSSETRLGGLRGSTTTTTPRSATVARGFTRGAASSSSSSLPRVNAGFAKMQERFAQERRESEMEEMEDGMSGTYTTEDLMAMQSSSSSSSSSSSEIVEEPKLAKKEEEEEEKRPPKTTDLGVPMECKSCALVLPVPDMNGQSFGKEIDSHDCVARINTHYLDSADERNAKYREDFGTKTDFVFANVVPHTLDELNRVDHSKVDKTVKHKILVLRSLDEKKTSDSSTEIPYQDPGSAKPEDVYRFLDANEGWVVTPEVISNEATELFSPLPGAEGKLWSSGFLAYTTLTRHFCESTTVYALTEDSENDNASKTDYFSSSLASQRQMWEGHSFGSEHEFMREEAKMGDYGVKVKTVVDQEKLAREEALRKEQEAAQKEQEEAQAAIAKKQAENEAMISAQQRYAKAAIDAAQEAAAKALLEQQAEEIVEPAVVLNETPQPEVIEAGEESASTGFEDVAAPIVDPNADLVGDQSTCTESFKDLFCNPALQCVGGIPCPGQGCCDRTSCNPADSCMPGVPIPGIGCCKDAEDWRPSWGPSRIDRSDPSALVNVILEDGTPKSIMVSELDNYINARVLKMTNPPPKEDAESGSDIEGDGDDDDTIVPAAAKKKIVVKKLKNPKEQKMLFELQDDESSAKTKKKHQASKKTAQLGMAAPTVDELMAALGKHHHHANEDTETQSADMFDMSKVEVAEEVTWKSGAAGGMANNNQPKGNNFMKDGKYDPPMFCDNSENCTPGQRWPGVGCCTPDSCNPDPSPNCQAGTPMPGYGCCSDKSTYRWDDKENRYKKIEYKEVTKDDLQVMMATKSLDIPGVEKPKVSYESIVGKDDIDLSSANVEAPEDQVIADFIQGKTTTEEEVIPSEEPAAEEPASEEGQEADAKAEVTEELIGDEGTVVVEEKEDAPEAESKPLFCNTQTEGCVAGVPIPGIPCCNAPDICNPEPKETCVAGVPLPGIPCCFQRQPQAQQNPDAQKDSALAKSLASSPKQTCNPDPKCTPGVPVPGVGCCKNGWGKVDGDAVEQLDTTKNEKEDILKDSVEALALKERIREELQRKDQLVNHKEDVRKMEKEKKPKEEKKAEKEKKAKEEKKAEEEKKIEDEAKELAEQDKPVDDVPNEEDVTTTTDAEVQVEEGEEEKSDDPVAENQDEAEQPATSTTEEAEKKSSKKSSKKNRASGKPEVWDSDY
jgi:hypothetical protein